MQEQRGAPRPEAMPAPVPRQETARSPGPLEPGLPAEGRAVLLEGCQLGREVRGFELRHLRPGAMGGDAFTEVYFATDSGNLYAVWRDARSGDCHMADARSNWNRGASLTGNTLPEEQVAAMRLQVGQPLDYGGGRHTSSVARILCVNGGRRYDPDYLADITDGPPAEDLRAQFETIVRGGR